MSKLLSATISMNQFQEILTVLSADVSICVRGRHAIGKSEGVYQAATKIKSDFYQNAENCKLVIEAFGGKVKVPVSDWAPTGYVTEWKYDYGIPVMERRLSQLTEGDIVGLPLLDGNKTSFKPCDWLIDSCRFPVMLFLDERNRAIDNVKQSVFQLTDSKGFYGYKLHEETRIAIAENIGGAYHVEDTDPAEVSRCVTYELEPTVAEWLEYAKGRCHQITVDFIRQEPRMLEYTGTFETNKKYADRRSWFKFDKELQRLGLLESDTVSPLLYTLACGFLGTEVASRFDSFVKNYDREVSAKDILKDWSTAKQKLSKSDVVSNERYLELMDKMTDYLKKEIAKNKKEGVLANSEKKQFALFLSDLPDEARVQMFTTIMSLDNSLIDVAKMVSQIIIKTINGDSIEEEREKFLNDTDEVGNEESVSGKARTRGRKKQ